MLDSAEDHAPPPQEEVSRIGRMLGMAVILIASIVVATVFMVFEVQSAAEARSDRSLPDDQRERRRRSP